MPIPDPQLRECLKAVGEFLEKKRPPPQIRGELDYRADIKGSDLMIVEVRPAFEDPDQFVEHPVAKVKWVSSRMVWRLFWMRADMKWHSYVPLPEAPTVRAVLDEVDRDPNGCFFG